LSYHNKPSDDISLLAWFEMLTNETITSYVIDDNGHEIRIGNQYQATCAGRQRLAEIHDERLTSGRTSK